MHKNEVEIQRELQEAARQIQLQGLYTHYKNHTQLYKVLHVAVTEWDDEVCVIYQAQYGINLIFVRPLKSWLEKVEWHGKTVDRFVKVA